jgi:hypothetical protein
MNAASRRPLTSWSAVAAYGSRSPTNGREIDAVGLKEHLRQQRRCAANRTKRHVRSSKVVDRIGGRHGADYQVQRIEVQHGHAAKLIERSRGLVELTGEGKVGDIGHRNTDISRAALEVFQARGRMTLPE